MRVSEPIIKYSLKVAKTGREATDARIICLPLVTLSRGDSSGSGLKL